VILCGKFPFKGINDTDLFKKIKKCKIDFPTHLSEDSKRLINRILKVAPNERPSAELVMQL
jgi:serine/threonine protein kinase